jgi:hypothetical protein
MGQFLLAVASFTPEPKQTAALLQPQYQAKENSGAWNIYKKLTKITHFVLSSVITYKRCYFMRVYDDILTASVV